ncbi:hypothetical protein BD413DRAFT_577504 [Trametes elegans]|nr:hypothetical protein BD413DRAFT_577504 [Trametes elegans]
MHVFKAALISTSKFVAVNELFSSVLCTYSEHSVRCVFSTTETYRRIDARDIEVAGYT